MKTFLLQSSDFFIIKYLHFDRSFCTCKSASLSVELDVGINRIDLVSLWVMRHPCNQACFLAMNVISSNAVELQSEGQSLLNQDKFILFPVLSFKLLGFIILWGFLSCYLENECMPMCDHRHINNTQQNFPLSQVLPL